MTTNHGWIDPLLVLESNILQLKSHWIWSSGGLLFYQFPVCPSPRDLILSQKGMCRCRKSV